MKVDKKEERWPLILMKMALKEEAAFYFYENGFERGSTTFILRKWL